MQMDKTRLATLIYWISEREKIRIAKEAGKPAPWTKDKVLATYRFCNVVRDDDRVTKWIHSRLRPVRLTDLEPAAFNCLVARWFNEPDTLKAIGWPFGVDSKWLESRVLNRLRMLVEADRKIFRAAYIINGALGMPGHPKYETVVVKVLSPARLEIGDCIVRDSCEHSWSKLRLLNGMGPFMAGQVVADWNSLGIIRGADAQTWAPLGPGSRRGIAILYNVEPNKINQKIAVKFMRDTFSHVKQDLPAIAQRMTLHDMQNCFCEFSKYVRGYGKQKFVVGG